MNKLIFELPCKHSVAADMDDAQAFMDGWNIQITCSSCNLTFEFNHSDGYLKSFRPEGVKPEGEVPIEFSWEEKK